MRMWCCDPRILCTKHLLGNHVEDHMFLGTLKKGVKVDGYIRNNLFEPLFLQIDHDLIAREMERRGMNHKTPLNFNQISDLKNLTEGQRNFSLDRPRSLNDLLSRCPECLKRYEDLHGKDSFVIRT